MLFLVVWYYQCLWALGKLRLQFSNNGQGAFNSSALTVIWTSLCPLFTSSWPQREALHLMRPSGWDVDKDYSCNHLVFWSSSTVNPSVMFVSKYDVIYVGIEMLYLMLLEWLCSSERRPAPEWILALTMFSFITYRGAFLSPVCLNANRCGAYCVLCC